MRERDLKTAEKFGVLDRCKAFEEDLLKIKDLVPDKHDDGVCFDLSGFWSDIRHVIIVPKYDIRAKNKRLLTLKFEAEKGTSNDVVFKHL